MIEAEYIANIFHYLIFNQLQKHVIYGCVFGGPHFPTILPQFYAKMGVIMFERL